MKRGGEWELVGVLKVIAAILPWNNRVAIFQGEGYNCRRNEFNGDGLWSK